MSTNGNGNGTVDPWESAANAVVPPRTYFGQVSLDVWFCVLEKGIGRTPFDPGMHKPEQKRTAITIEVQPLASSNLEFAVRRELIAESREWAGIVLPSIKALGLNPKDVNGKFVQCELTETGRKYTNASGEEKTATTIKFLAAFDSEAACEQAAGAATRASEQAQAAAAAAQPAPAAAAPVNGGNGSNREQETAAKFLPALWRQAAGDVTRFSELIAGNPLTSRYFSINSPEVLALVTA